MREIRTIMDAVEFVLCCNPYATAADFPHLTESQREQVRLLIESTYWHQEFAK